VQRVVPLRTQFIATLHGQDLDSPMLRLVRFVAPEVPVVSTNCSHAQKPPLVVSAEQGVSFEVHNVPQRLVSLTGKSGREHRVMVKDALGESKVLKC